VPPTVDHPTADVQTYEDLTVAVAADLELLQRGQASADLDEVVRRLLTGPDGQVDLAGVARLLVATAAYAIEHWDASHEACNPLLDSLRVGAQPSSWPVSWASQSGAQPRLASRRRRTVARRPG
jgi:hypothetical protein